MALTNAQKQRRFRDKRKQEMAALRAGVPPVANRDRSDEAKRKRAVAAINEMNSLPAPSDMAKLLDGSDEACLIDGNRVEIALAWLTAFDKAFRRP